MSTRISSIWRTALAVISIWSLTVNAHTVITYPGWRGNNLHSNGSVFESNGLIEGPNNTYPYGMQWAYPCGGLPTSENRTLWPVKGGAVAIQPGWFPGHLHAFFYINLGFGNFPPNMSNPMIPPFQINGPTNDPYPGTFCFPQVPLPVNASVKVGDNATIQIIETAKHGAALYNCVDITFAEPEDVEEVNENNCFNSSTITFELVYSTTSQSEASTLISARLLAFVPLLIAVLFHALPGF